MYYAIKRFMQEIYIVGKRSLGAKKLQKRVLQSNKLVEEQISQSAKYIIDAQEIDKLESIVSK